MRIKMIPGEYNAELVETVKNMMKQPDYGELLDEFATQHGKEALMDAMYYAHEKRDEQLADQEAYFQQQLTDDELPYFIKRFLAS